MNAMIIRDGPVEPVEIEDLRQAAGWDRSEGTYEKTLLRHFMRYIARDDEDRLVGYMSVLSDGVSDAFLVDLIVHPDCRRTGLGTRIVRRAIRDLRAAGVRCVQVTFTDDLEPFYAQCGFHIFKAGIIDFKHMTVEEQRQLGSAGEAGRGA